MEKIKQFLFFVLFIAPMLMFSPAKAHEKDRDGDNHGKRGHHRDNDDNVSVKSKISLSPVAPVGVNSSAGDKFSKGNTSAGGNTSEGGNTSSGDNSYAGGNTSGGGNTSAGGNNNSSGGNVPLDGGIGLLLAAGIGYGIKKVADRKKLADKHSDIQ